MKRTSNRINMIVFAWIMIAIYSDRVFGQSADIKLQCPENFIDSALNLVSCEIDSTALSCTSTIMSISIQRLGSSTFKPLCSTDQAYPCTAATSVPTQSGECACTKKDGDRFTYTLAYNGSLTTDLGSKFECQVCSGTHTTSSNCGSIGFGVALLLGGVVGFSIGLTVGICIGAYIGGVPLWMQAWLKIFVLFIILLAVKDYPYKFLAFIPIVAYAVYVWIVVEVWRKVYNLDCGTVFVLTAVEPVPFVGGWIVPPFMYIKYDRGDVPNEFVYFLVLIVTVTVPNFGVAIFIIYININGNFCFAGIVSSTGKSSVSKGRKNSTVRPEVHQTAPTRLSSNR